MKGLEDLDQALLDCRLASARAKGAFFGFIAGYAIGIVVWTFAILAAGAATCP